MADFEDLELDAFDAGGVAASAAAVLAALVEEAALARRSGDFEGALDTFLNVLDIEPNHVEARLAAAEISRLTGNGRQALHHCLHLLELDPRHIGARMEMAEALLSLGEADEAHAIHALLLHERPDDPQTWCALARLLAEDGQNAAAETCLRRALVIDPAHAPSQAGLGHLLHHLGDHTGAIEALNHAILLEPDCTAHHVGLATALMACERFEEAAVQIDRAMALDDEDAGAHLLRAELATLEGHLRQAWADAYWRWHLPDHLLPHLPGQRWEGEALDGQPLLLFADGTDAETIRMVRFLPRLVEDGIRISLMAQPGLVPLFEELGGLEHLTRKDEPPPVIGLDHCAWAPLGDLPLLLGLDTADVTALPYITAPARRRRPVVVPPGIAIKVGVAWGGPQPVPLGELLPLSGVDGAVLFALQTGTTDAGDLADPSLITDLAPTIADFADLAGRIAEMDVVIATDGAVAELAGAMGKPVWLVLSTPSSAVWMRNRDDSPWYPSARLFRRAPNEGWAALVARLRAALRAMVAERLTVDADLRRAHSGPEAVQTAMMLAHLQPGDLLVDIAAGHGELTLEAALHHSDDVRVIALEPHPAAAEALRDMLSISGGDNRAEVVQAAAGPATGQAVLAAPAARSGRRVFTLPAWVPVNALTINVGDLLDQRPDLEGRRLLLRLGQTGWEQTLLEGLHPLIVQGRVAAITFGHRPGTAMASTLAGMGFTLWQLPDEIAHGRAIPFLEEEAGSVLALARDIAPADAYGPQWLPPSQAEIDAALADTERLTDDGIAHQSAGRLGDAAACYAQALMRDPFAPGANANKGVLMHMAGRREAAAACYARALLRQPNPAVAANLGGVLRELGRLDESEDAFRKAASETPDDLYGLALLRRDQGRLAQAASLLERSLALRPGTPYVGWVLAQVLLALGRREEGFALFGNRQVPPPPMANLPLWRGEDLAARSILVHNDGDLADAVLFARFIPQVAAKGGLVTVACPHELAPLMHGIGGVEAVVSGDDPIPASDFRIGLADLPRMLPPDAIGRLTPLPLPDGVRSRRFPRDGKLRVGLAWGGRPTGKGCPLAEMLSLAVDPGIVLVSLVDGDGADEIDRLGARTLVERITPSPADLGETAGVIAGLDLVVGGDGIETHLAAALGKPAWVLVPDAFTWRWQAGREDSPFYPTARVFRQVAAGSWRPTIRRIAAALKVLAARKRRDVWYD